MYKLGKVTQADEFLVTITLFDGKKELFFSDLKGWNKSLKLGDECKVFYKHIFGAGIIGYKVTRITEKTRTSKSAIRLA